jgi:raffinose/stachyose/melibiose transport system permease protein
MGKKKTLIKRKKLFVTIVLIIASFIVAIPLYYVLINAFKRPEFIQFQPFFITPEQFTLNNIFKTFVVMKYLEALMNNIIILFISIGIVVLIGSMTGFAVAVTNTRILKIYFVFTVLIIAVPFQIVMVPLSIIMKKTYLINNYFGTSLVYVAISLPIVIFLYTGFMRSLPKELSEAAIMDGCSLAKSYFYVYMPLMKATTSTVMIIRGSFVWNDFIIPLITISKASMTPLTLRLYGFASTRFNSWDLIFGGTLLCSIPVLILFILLQRYFISGMIAGAVKG